MGEKTGARHHFPRQAADDDALIAAVADNRFMDESAWPINRLEALIIQLVWKAVLHPAEGERDLIDAGIALTIRLEIEYTRSVERWEHNPASVEEMTDAWQARLRRRILAFYGPEIFKQVQIIQGKGQKQP